MTEQAPPTIEGLLYNLVGLPDAMEDFQEQLAAAGTDVAKLTELKIQLEVFMELSHKDLADAKDILGGEPSKRDGRVLSRAEQLLGGEESSFAALLKEVQDLLPAEEAAEEVAPESEAQTGLTRSELLEQAREKLEASKEIMDPTAVALFELLIAAMEKTPATAAATRGSKKEEKIELPLEERQDEALEKSGKRGFLSGFRRQFARTGKAALTLGGRRGREDMKEEVLEHREISAILKRALKTISSETDLRNTVDQLMRENKGVMGLKNSNKAKDILALALFLKDKGLIGDYETGLKTADFWDEEKMDDVVRGEIDGVASVLKRLYDKDGEDGEFHQYIKRQARFFAKVFNAEVAEAPAKVKATPGDKILFKATPTPPLDVVPKVETPAVTLGGKEVLPTPIAEEVDATDFI
ncbi:hypothetical protein KJ654_00645 [Patescibacteria group bacterium]|nr:hypothetical protein [Patescibacteria group bacterium]MBU1966716.1 hypothetical protein [Patescibacteria group bacterium]